MQHSRSAQPSCRLAAAALLPLFIALHTFGQDSTAQKKRWLAISFVAEHRAVPFYTDNTGGAIDGKVPFRRYNQGLQLAGPNLGVDLRKNIFRYWVEAGYSIRLKYGHLYYESDLTSGIKESVKAWTADYLFSLHGRIPVGSKKEIRVTVGHGFMNRGSDYAITEVDTLSNGQLVGYGITGNFHYVSDFVSLSYNVRGLEGGISAYYTAESGYDNPSPFVLLGLFLKYDIWR